MKSTLRLSLLTAILALTPLVSRADRWSTDETAVRMGVRSWVTLQARLNPQSADADVKALYISQTAVSSIQDIARPAATVHPKDVAVTLQGDRAVSTFQIQEPPFQVVLKWERRSGVWKIVDESVTPKSVERVAISESPRK